MGKPINLIRPKAMMFVFADKQIDKIHCPQCGAEMVKGEDVVAALEQAKYTCPECGVSADYLPNN